MGKFGGDDSSFIFIILPPPLEILEEWNKNKWEGVKMSLLCQTSSKHDRNWFLWLFVFLSCAFSPSPVEQIKSPLSGYSEDHCKTNFSRACFSWKTLPCSCLTIDSLVEGPIQKSIHSLWRQNHCNLFFLLAFKRFTSSWHMVDTIL